MVSMREVYYDSLRRRTVPPTPKQRGAQGACQSFVDCEVGFTELRAFCGRLPGHYPKTHEQIVNLPNDVSLTIRWT